MKRRFHLGEWALLLIPSLMLAGFAVWNARTKSPYPSSDDPTSPTILSAKIEPVTSLDVYNGWDTRFVLVAQVPSHLRPKQGDYSKSVQVDFNNATLNFEREKQKIVLPISNSKMSLRLVSNGESTTTTLLMKLRDLPVTSSPVMLQGNVVANYYRPITVKGGSRYIRSQSKPIALQLQVRDSKERVVLPVVPRYRPFTLDNVIVKHENIFSGISIESDTTVKMIFSGTDASNPAFTPSLHNIRLVDESGKEHQSFFSPNTKAPVSPMWSMQNAIESPDGKFHQWISFPVGFLPQSAGRIRFKTDVSVDNCWPLEVSVVVRSK